MDNDVIRTPQEIRTLTRDITTQFRHEVDAPHQSFAFLLFTNGISDGLERKPEAELGEVYKTGYRLGRDR